MSSSRAHSTEPIPRTEVEATRPRRTLERPEAESEAADQDLWALNHPTPSRKTLQSKLKVNHGDLVKAINVYFSTSGGWTTKSAERLYSARLAWQEVEAVLPRIQFQGWSWKDDVDDKDYNQARRRKAAREYVFGWLMEFRFFFEKQVAKKKRKDAAASKSSSSARPPGGSDKPSNRPKESDRRPPASKPSPERRRSERLIAAASSATRSADSASTSASERNTYITPFQGYHGSPFWSQGGLPGIAYRPPLARCGPYHQYQMSRRTDYCPEYRPYDTSSNRFSWRSSDGTTATRDNRFPPSSHGRRRPFFEDAESREERVRDLQRQREGANKYMEELDREKEMARRVQKFKERLLKKKPAGGSGSGGAAALEEETEPEEAEAARNLSPENISRHFNSDLPLSRDDFRSISSGLDVASSTSTASGSAGAEVDAASGSGSGAGGGGDPTTASNDFLFPNQPEVYAKVTQPTNAHPEGSTTRVANSAAWKDPEWWQKREAERKRKLSELQDEEEEEEADDVAEAGEGKRLRLSSRDSTPDTADNRLVECSRLTDRLKAIIRQKDKPFLQKLIDSPNSMKRVLMAKLIDEHRSQVSRNLNKLRFSQKSRAEAEAASAAGDANQANSPSPSESALSLLSSLKLLESHEQALAEVNLTDLPDEFLRHVDTLIKSEVVARETTQGEGEEEDQRWGEGAEKDDDDEVVELPVPPKPPAPVITLVEEDIDDEDEMEMAPALATPNSGASNQRKENGEEEGGDGSSSSSSDEEGDSEEETSAAAPEKRAAAIRDQAKTNERGNEAAVPSEEGDDDDDDDDGSPMASAPNNTNTGNQSPLETLEALAQDEQSTFEQLRALDQQRNELMNHLEYLSFLRSKILATTMGGEK